MCPRPSSYPGPCCTGLVSAPRRCRAQGSDCSTCLTHRRGWGCRWRKGQAGARRQLAAVVIWQLAVVEHWPGQGLGLAVGSSAYPDAAEEDVAVGLRGDEAGLARCQQCGGLAGIGIARAVGGRGCRGAVGWGGRGPQAGGRAAVREGVGVAHGTRAQPDAAGDGVAPGLRQRAAGLRVGIAAGRPPAGRGSACRPWRAGESTRPGTAEESPEATAREGIAAGAEHDARVGIARRTLRPAHVRRDGAVGQGRLRAVAVGITAGAEPAADALGEPGAQVTPRVGTPPSSVHRLGSVG